MSSTHPLAEFSGLSFSVSLRVRHPSLDPDTITSTLGITPEHCWGCGEPRRSASGAKLGGKHRETYWSASLPEPMGQLPGQSSWPVEPGTQLALHLIPLRRHRAFFDQIRNEGGDASLLVELAPEMAFRLDAAVMRQLGELGLAVEFEVITQMSESVDANS